MATTRTVPKGWATRAEVAEYTGLAVQTLANLKAQGQGPPCKGRGRGLRYAWADVERWMRERT
jgi:phage terminase Nu1 subunit (DNA packaging protein)